MKTFEFVFKNIFNNRLERCRVEAINKNKAIVEFTDATNRKSFLFLKEVK